MAGGRSSPAGSAPLQAQIVSDSVSRQETEPHRLIQLVHGIVPLTQVGQEAKRPLSRSKQRKQGRMPCWMPACWWPRQPDQQLEDDEAERDYDQGPPEPTNEQSPGYPRATIDAETKPKLQLNIFVCSTGVSRQETELYKPNQLLRKLIL